MRDVNILKRISERMLDLPKRQRFLAEYILNNYKDVANLSALELGTRVGVSDATVVRFAKTLGFSGYTEIKQELFNHLTHDDNPSEKMIKSLSRAKQINSDVAEVFQNDIQNIQETLASFSKENMDAAVQSIHQAKRVFILGLNSCESLAGFLNFHLRRISMDVHLVTSGGMVLLEQLNPISGDDVLVVISYPRYSIDTFSGIELAKSRGCKVISITDKIYSPIAEASDIALIAQSTSPGFYNSFAAATTICNVLVFSVALINEEKSVNALKALEKVKNDIYL